MISNLATKLRNGTPHDHTMAEHTRFIQGFLNGTVSRDSFGKFLSSLYCIYSQLETQLDRHQHHAVVGKVYLLELNRTAHLERDLAFYYGKNWREQVIPTLAAQAYIYRIRQISNTEPALLVAHAYMRSMGILSANQGLKQIAQSAFNRPEHQGIAFYEFEQIPDIKAFQDKYRQVFDELPVDEETADQIVAEASTSFKFNRQMFQELEKKSPVAVG